MLTINGSIPSGATISGEEEINLELTTSEAKFDNDTGSGGVNVILTSLPIVSIVSGASSATQGHSFGFVLEASPAPVAEFDIELRFRDFEDDTITGIVGATSFGSNTGIVTIPTSGRLPVTVTTANPGGTSGDDDGTVNVQAS